MTRPLRALLGGMFILPTLLLATSASAQQASIRALELRSKRVGVASVDEYRLEAEAGYLAKAESVDLVLPDGVFTAKRLRLEEREAGFFWVGKVHGAWDVLLTSHDGALAGLIYTPWVVYEVFSGPDGSPRLAHLDHDEFPGCAQSDVPADSPTDSGAPAGSAFGPSMAAAASAGDPVIMDVMVVYTPQARSGAGGTSQIQSTIRSAIDITNTAYANSDIDAQLRLVHSQEVTYNDSGSSSSDLSFVTNDPTVAALRDTYGADLVGLIVNSNEACGRGYVQRSPGASFERYAFQVTTRSCAVGNLSFAHEFGHNQGCEHDPANGTSPSNASFPYSFGHFHSGAYRTVMSYSNQCVGGCTRAPYFSNPAVSNQGLATGIADQRDNHRTINNTAGIVAAFRPTASTYDFGAATRNQADAATFYSQSLSGSPTSPVVIMGPPSFNGGDPSVVRVRGVTGSGFEYQLDEWDYKDGAHTTETIGWLALDAGAQNLGTLAAEAGAVTVNHGWVTVSLNQSFGSTPVVLATVATYNGSQAATTRIRNVTSTSFQVRLQEEEGNDGTHADETVHYLAIEPGTTTVNGDKIVVGRTGNSVTHAFATIGFSAVNSPVFLAGMQTFDGGDAAAVRYRNLGSSSVQVKIEEEGSADAEINHTTEVVGYVVIGGP